MGVSATGVKVSVRVVRRSLALLLVLLALAFYYLGPPITPAQRASAASACNKHAGENFRSYRLSWDLSKIPHWECWDARDPEAPAISLGWWATRG